MYAGLDYTAVGEVEEVLMPMDVQLSRDDRSSRPASDLENARRDAAAYRLTPTSRALALRLSLNLAASKVCIFSNTCFFGSHVVKSQHEQVSLIYLPNSGLAAGAHDQSTAT